ncbi:carcinoembryonic antigen-related cell adhesion molecule 3-like [Echinops telfairi]|uniref:Carcinoembryonic antigen-related cell adhesion molecule 3-like n=1 Tax=Echinops telfairi TaxID=9371 RepID=A0AC55D8Y3_ECHTE|nr:carcinoembryonic antigen-related cell adhesion molecule 3-like [Echinops telfairi]
MGRRPLALGGSTMQRTRGGWKSITWILLLLSWIPPSTGQLTIESVPRAAAEGQDVLLRHSSQAEAAFYNWYKGNSVLIPNNRIGTYAVPSGIFTRGPAHTGRETIYPNGSLLLQNVTLGDTGTYMVQITKADGVPEKLTGQIHVFRVGSEGGQVLSAGAITGIVIAVGVFLVAALGCFLFRTRTKGSQSDPGHQQPPASTSGRDQSDNSASMHPLYANQAAVPIYEDLLKPDTNIYCKIHPR